ncbi:CCHC-type domain-containing protein [Trichonephila clavipes]|nr:CCHC-type domain-containing protein [Trichonephila clavipes]
MRKERVVPLRYERQPNVTPISTANEEDLSHLVRRIEEEIEEVLPRIVTCINDGPSDLESIIREEVRSNLAPLTREKPVPSPYRTKRTHESSLRPRPISRQENRPIQQDTGRKTGLWRTSDNIPICFHCELPGHVTRYCRDRRRVFSATRQRRQLDQYERWDSDSVSDYGRDHESNYQRYRSNSPYPRRNPQRRESRSPSRRSPVRTMGSLVVRALDSKLEGLSLMPVLPNTLRVHTEYVLAKSVGPKVLLAESRVQGTGENFPPLQFDA